MTNHQAGRLVVAGWAAAFAFCIAACVALAGRAPLIALLLYLSAFVMFNGAIYNYLHFWSDRRDE